MLFGIRSRPFFLLLGAFLLCTIIALSEATFESEKNFMKLIQESSGNSIVDLGVWLITESGNVFVMLPFSIVLLVIRRTRRIGMTLLILIVISTILTGYIKCGVDRDRPFLTWEGTEFPITIEPDSFSLFCDGKSWTAGFPSGHAARAGVLLGMILWLGPDWIRATMIVYSPLMALARISMGLHYLSDVLAGFGLGLILSTGAAMWLTNSGLVTYILSG